MGTIATQSPTPPPGNLTTHGILQTDTHLTISSWNEWLEVKSGYPSSAMVGQALLSVFPELGQRGLDDVYRRALAGEAVNVAQRQHHYLFALPAPPNLAGFSVMQQNTQVAPLRQKNQIIGTVTVIEDVTERVAVEQALNDQAARLTALAEVSRALHDTRLQPQAVLLTVARQVGQLVGDLAIIRLLTDDEQWLVAKAVFHVDAATQAEVQAALLSERHRADAGANGRAVRTGRPQRLSGVELEALRADTGPAYWPTVDRAATYSLLAVPLIVHGRVLGTVSISRQRPDRPYTDVDEQLLVEMTGLAALAVEKARLYEAEQRERERATLLSEFSRLLAVSLDYQTTLQRVVDLLVPRLADYSFVDILDDQQGVVRVAVAHRSAELTSLLRRPPLDLLRSGHPVVEALTSGQAYLLSEIDDRLLESIARDDHHREALRRLGPTSFIAIPLHARGRTLGTVSCGMSTSGRRFGHADLALLEEAVGRAAIAIDNARLYEEVRASEEFSRTILESSADCISVLELDGRLISMNAPGLSLMEIDDIGPFIGRSWVDLWPTDQWATITSAMEEARAGGTVHFQGVCPTAKGTSKWWDVMISPVLGALGQPRHLLSASRDITEQKRTEAERERMVAEINEAGVLYRGLFDGVADSIVVLDIDKRSIIEVNRAAATLLGEPTTALIGATPFDYIADQATAEEVIRTTIERGTWRGELDLRRRIGTTVPIELQMTVLGLAHRTLAVMALRDISERRTLERQQQEFLSMVTHELKNPLAGISGMAQLMQRRAEYSEKAVANIIERTNHLERLLSELLDVSRLAAGRLELQPETVELIAVLRTLVDGLQTVAPAHRLRIEAPARPLIGRWDRVRVTQIFHNLLANAIKYSPDGGPVDVRVSVRHDVVTVRVIDQGIGMTADDRLHLFSRFFRGQAARYHHIHGLGLGLAVTKTLVEAHGGTIMVESTPAVGSTFSVMLPLYQDGEVPASSND